MKISGNTYSSKERLLEQALLETGIFVVLFDASAGDSLYTCACNSLNASAGYPFYTRTGNTFYASAGDSLYTGTSNAFRACTGNIFQTCVCNSFNTGNSIALHSRLNSANAITSVCTP